MAGIFVNPGNLVMPQRFYLCDVASRFTAISMYTDWQHWDLGRVFCLLLGVSPDYAQPITGQVISPSVVQIMACRVAGTKPLSEPMLVKNLALLLAKQSLSFNVLN